MTDPNASRPVPINVGPRRPRPIHGDDHWLNDYWYETPREDPAWPDVYTYCDAIGYAPGDEVRFHGSTTAKTWSLQVDRDGSEPEVVYTANDLPGTFTPTPKEAYRTGCGWPVVRTWRLPQDLRSGFYRVISSCTRKDGSRFVQYHFFVVRPTQETRQAKILLVLTTGTWTSYNNWGGANHYAGIAGPNGDRHSPVLSLERPWTRGLVWLPPGAPRICTVPTPQPGDPPRYPQKEWAYANGFGPYYASSGWAQYERNFVIWAEKEGYALDMITQTDLHYRPELLEGYQCVVTVGHDEYWSHDMRKAIERFTEAGGRVARLGANFMWQIRLEDEGRRQVCYKFTAWKDDPIRDTADAHLLTSGWEDPKVAWPGSTTFGVNGFEGLYASWGGFAPRGQRGFTVYRAKHWVFDKTDLSYGDIFGAEAQIFAYEVDGLDYTFRDGLPYPTGRDGADTAIEILAMAPAMFAEEQPVPEGFRHYIGDEDLIGMTRLLNGGTVTPEALARWRYGSGMMVHMKKGRGEVVSAATCEWVNGLRRGCPFTQQITRNLLDRFTAG